jgi:hypothetical protein
MGLILNNSRLRDYEKCPRKFYWSSIRNLWRGFVGVDAEEGLLMHDVLPCWYDNQSMTACHTIIDAHFDKKLSASNLMEEEVDWFTERKDYFKRLLDAYIKRYAGKEDWIKVDSEVSFITCLGDSCYNCAHPYAPELIKGLDIQQFCPSCSHSIFYVVGRGDMLIKERGLLKLVDHKTKGGKSPSITEPYLLAFNESPQFTTYMYGLGRVLEKKIHYGIANCIAKLKTIDERGNPFHRNEEITRNETDFLLFVEDRINLFQQIQEDMAKLDPEHRPSTRCFRRNTNACRDYGKCAYYDLCFPNGFAKGNWWELPVGCDFETRGADYVDDYRNLIAEEMR